MPSGAKGHMLLMMLAGLMLLAGLWAGLGRLGWNLPQPGTGLAGLHGPLMVSGFLGTLIGLERAMAVESVWAYSAPVFAALGALALLAGFTPLVGQILILFGSLILVAIFARLFHRHGSPSLATMALGAIVWAVGNGLWMMGYPLYRVVPWWVGFLVLTIAGERLELSRLLRLSFLSRIGFSAAGGMLVFSLVASLVAFDAAIRMAGIGLVAFAGWLLRYDIAWRIVSHPGLHRFMALCLLTGYVWLGTGGFMWVGFASEFRAGPLYDAMLHTIFLGFVFSMIFAHASIILPSITGMTMPFQAAFYGHWVLLQLSLVLRVGGDLTQWRPGIQWGGLLNVLALLIFLANNIRAVRIGELAGREPLKGWGT